MKVTIEDIEGEVWAHKGDAAPTRIRCIVVIDLDRMGDVVRRAYRGRHGEASWADKGITAYVQDEREAANG